MLIVLDLTETQAHTDTLTKQVNLHWSGVLKVNNDGSTFNKVNSLKILSLTTLINSDSLQALK